MSHRSPRFIKCKSVQNAGAQLVSLVLNERPLYSWLLLGKNAYLLEPVQRNYTKIFNDQLLLEISLHFYITIIDTTDSVLQSENSRGVYTEYVRNITLLAMTFKDLVAPKRAVCLSG